MISDEDYKDMQASISIATAVLAGIDGDRLDAFIERADRAMGIGPILHPTEWREAADQLELILSHARTLRAARVAVVHARNHAAALARRGVEGETF